MKIVSRLSRTLILFLSLSCFAVMTSVPDAHASMKHHHGVKKHKKKAHKEDVAKKTGEKKHHKKKAKSTHKKKKVTKKHHKKKPVK